MVSLFTGQLSSHFGGEHKLNERVPTTAWTLPQSFRKASYRTAAFTANSVVSGPGFEQGFDEFWNLAGHQYFDDSFLLKRLLAGRSWVQSLSLMERLELQKETAGNMSGIARDWLADHGDEAFFLYLHLLDPHWPHYNRGHGAVPPDLQDIESPLSHLELIRLGPSNPKHEKYRVGPRMDELRSRYDDEIRSADQAIGELLDTLREFELDDSTLVVVLGDHGEEFVEHLAFGHGRDVHDEVIHVQGDRPKTGPQRVV